MTVRTVTDEELGQIARKQADLFRRVREGTLSPNTVNSQLQLLIERRRLVDNIWHPFVWNGEQWQNVCRWNDIRGWGFSEAELELVNPNRTTMASTILAGWTNPSPLCTLVLVPFLDSVQQTMRELWEIVKSQFSTMEFAGNQGFDAWAERVTLQPGVEHSRGLRWCLVDLGAHCNPLAPSAVAKVRSKLSAHAHVLAAAAHFPGWCHDVQTNHGAPRPIIAGYRVGDVPRKAAYYSPYLGGHNDGRILLGNLSLKGWGTSLKYYSVPEAIDVTDAWLERQARHE